MASEEVDLSMYDRNTAIARASEEQSKINTLERARSLGIPITVKGGLAYIAISDAVEIVEQLTQQLKQYENND
jgi:hypothetical protein